MKNIDDTGRLGEASALIAVVDAGGFSAAARRLGIAQSTLSRRVDALERRLRVPLLLRTTRRLALTEAGRDYLARVGRAMAQLDEAERSVGLQDEEPEGVLRMTVPAVYGRKSVLPALLSLVRSWPRLRLDIEFNDRRADLHREGFDLAVRMEAGDAPPGYVSHAFATGRLLTVAGAAYVRTHGIPDSLDDLAKHAFIATKTYTPRVEAQFQRDGVRRKVRAEPQHVFDDSEAVSDAVAEGLGISVLPDWLVRPALESGRMVRLLSDWTLPEYSICLLIRRDLSASKKVIVLKDALSRRHTALSSHE